MDPADRRFFSGLIVAVFAVAVFGYSLFLAGQSRIPVPAPAPAVVSPYVPAPYVPCPPFKPFNINCPYCRNVLSVQPSQTGQTGATVTGASIKSSAK